MPLNTTVVDRDVEHPNRIQLTPVGGTTDTYDLTPVPGSVVQAGTAVTASLLNSAGIEVQTPAAGDITAPADADVLPVVQTATLKKITWANIKATLKTYLDTLYAPVVAATANIADAAVTTPKLATNATVDNGKFIKSGMVVSAGTGLAINVTAGTADLNGYHGVSLGAITNQAVAGSSTLFVFLRYTLSDGTTAVVTNASFTGLSDGATYKYLPIARITTSVSAVSEVIPVYSWPTFGVKDAGSTTTGAFSQSCTQNTYYDLPTSTLTSFIPATNAKIRFGASSSFASSAAAGVVIWFAVREGTTIIAQISTQAPISGWLIPMTIASAYDLTAGTAYTFKLSVAHSATNTLAQQSAGTYFHGLVVSR